MWGVLEKSAEHVSVYSTICGKAWYLCVFVFRLIVIATIGGSVYSDEQSAFRCSTKVIGCDNVCYDRFAKISHMRFWAFQLLALCSPVVVFHFYTIYITSRIEVVKKKNDQLTENCGEEGMLGEMFQSAHVHQRKGPIVKKQRVIFDDKAGTREVNLTAGIQAAYVLCIVARMVIEIIFLYLAYDMFRFASYPDSHSNGAVVSDGNQISSPIDLFWIEVPQLYRCSGPTVQWACGQHLLPGNNGNGGYVPCWVSRPWEKTIILRYMNTLSVVCLFLSLAEIIQVIVRYSRKYNRNRKNKYLQKASGNSDVEKQEPKQKMIESGFSIEKPTSDEKLLLEAGFPIARSTGRNDYVTEPKRDNSNDVLRSISEGKITVGDIRTALQKLPGSTEQKARPRPTRQKLRSVTGSRRNLEIHQPDSEAEEVPPRQSTNVVSKRRTTSDDNAPILFFPDGTQSLNRPRKVSRAKYKPMFKFGSISFTHSEDEVEEQHSGDGQQRSKERKTGSDQEKSGVDTTPPPVTERSHQQWGEFV